MAKRTIALIVFEGVQALDVAGPLDVFATANRFVSDDDGYDCLLVAAGKTPVRCSNGMLLSANLSFDEAHQPFNTVLVAGGPALPDADADHDMSAWLQDWGVKADR